MSHTKYFNANAEVAVSLDEWHTDDLVEELENRNYDFTKDVSGVVRELLEQIWLKRRMDKDYQSELDQLIYDVLGKVV